MNDLEKIESILGQENYKVENGKIFRLDNFGEWCEQKVNAKNQIQLRDAKGNTELFNWTLIHAVITDAPIVVETSEAQPMISHIKIEHRDIPFKEGKKLWNETTKHEKKYTSIRSAEIKIIRKMLDQKKSINKIAEAINSNRFAVSYIVKQIKAGKKLKNEK